MLVTEIIVTFLFSLYPEWSDDYEHNNPIIEPDVGDIKIIITENGNEITKENVGDIELVDGNGNSNANIIEKENILEKYQPLGIADNEGSLFVKKFDKGGDQSSLNPSFISDKVAYNLKSSNNDTKQIYLN